MRRLALLAVSLSAAVGAASCTGAVENGCGRALHDRTLRPGVGFGGLRLGMSAADVEAWIGPPERLTGKAWEYPSCGFGLAFGPDQRLGALLAGGHPTLNERFTVESEEGLGIGSSREEIVDALGEPPSTSSAGRMLHYDARGIVWTLDEGGRVSHLTIRRPRPDVENDAPRATPAADAV